MNLAVNNYATFEPTACKKKMFGSKSGGKEEAFSIWNTIQLRGDLTVKEVIEAFEERYGFEVTSVSTADGVTLYNDVFDDEDEAEQKISSLYAKKGNRELPEDGIINLNIDGDYLDDDDYDDDDDDDDEDDDDNLVPPCILMLKG